MKKSMDEKKEKREKKGPRKPGTKWCNFCQWREYNGRCGISNDSHLNDEGKCPFWQKIDEQQTPNPKGK